MEKIRIGVIGLGFGRFHVRTLANMEEAELVAVADANPDLPGGLEGYAAGYGAKAYRELRGRLQYSARLRLGSA